MWAIFFFSSLPLFAFQCLTFLSRNNPCGCLLWGCFESLWNYSEKQCSKCCSADSRLWHITMSVSSPGLWQVPSSAPECQQWCSQAASQGHWGGLHTMGNTLHLKEQKFTAENLNFPDLVLFLSGINSFEFLKNNWFHYGSPYYDVVGRADSHLCSRKGPFTLIGKETFPQPNSTCPKCPLLCLFQDNTSSGMPEFLHDLVTERLTPGPAGLQDLLQDSS